MEIARVLGPVQAVRTVEGAERIRWVRLDCGGAFLTAADLVCADRGDLVLVCRGSAAGRLTAECPVDAAVVAVLEEVEKKIDKPGERQL